MSTLRAFFHVLVVTLLALLLGGCRAQTNGTPVPEAGSAEVKPEKARAAGEMIEVGMTAPEFTALDEAGNEVSLAQFRGKKNVVLIFYPGDSTPGCTSQLCAVRDDWKMFQDRDAVAFGVNHAGAASHAKFRETWNFPFPLLVDEGSVMAKAYGCEGTLFATKRTVFGINKEGRIVFAERGMPSNTEILAAFDTGQ